MKPTEPRAGASVPLVAEVVVRYGDRILDVRHVSGGHYRIGEGPGADVVVQLPRESGDGVALVVALADQLVFGLVPGMTGEIVRGEQTIALSDLLAQGRRSYGLARGDRCEAWLGALRFTVTTVEPADWAPARRSVDRLYAVTNLGAALAIGALILLGEPRAPGELALEEASASRERVIRYLTDLPPPPPEPPKPAVQPVLKTRISTRLKPSAPRPAAAPPPPAAPLLAEVTPPVPGRAAVPKGERRGMRDDYAYARTVGMLGDEEFVNSVGSALADAQEGLLSYEDTPEALAFWNGVASSKPRSRPFGGLELAETERGGGKHGERVPTPTTSGKRVEVDVHAKGPGPSAEARAAARLVMNVKFAEPYVQGDMNAQSVLEALRKQDGTLRRCYKDTVGSEDIAGTVIFKLKVNADGKVTSATIDWSSGRFGEIGACIKEVAGGWKFPPPMDHKPATIAVEALMSARRF